ncbi:MAG: SH3 domain-containing protein [Butyrivibrio sp.]|nr:SH3 domain-containing protein [Butyrivibrio sp.]
MNKKDSKKKNLILLSALFATALTVCGAGSAPVQVSATDIEAAASEALTAPVIPEESAAAASSQVIVDPNAASSQVSIDPNVVNYYETPENLFTTDTVNIRTGAGTDYEKIGKLKWGTPITVTGETGSGWYEISYNDGIGYINSKFASTALPGIPYLFVGDSRTVQMQVAVGSTDKAYVAKIGEGYNWFKNNALGKIPQYAGNGTTMIINFGVNDIANASKYIKLVNNNIDAWTQAGITVYYAAVTPVGKCQTVSNDQIERFNAKLKAGLDPRVNWLDGYSYLKQNGYYTSDGLHYNNATYKSLYSYYMSVIGTTDV